MTRDRYGELIEDDTADDAEAHTCDAGWIDREADHPRPCLTCRPWLTTTTTDRGGPDVRDRP